MPDEPATRHDHAAAAAIDQAGYTGHAGHGADADAETLRSPAEAMGHGGHGGTSMAAMVADMRNRFLVALLFSLPIVVWSPIGSDVLGWTFRCRSG